MTTFTVDPHGLMQLAQKLSSIGTDIDSLTKQIESLKGQGISLGGGGLEAATADVGQQWGYGLQQLDKHVKNIVRDLTEASTKYTATEDQIVQAEERLEASIQTITVEG